MSEDGRTGGVLYVWVWRGEVDGLIVKRFRYHLGGIYWEE